MGLSDDQRALLRLLAQREEGYEDIAALKGLSVEQVRAEVRQALAALQAADEPPPPPPPAPVEEKPKAETPPPPAAEPKQPAKPTARKPRPGVPVERRRFMLLAGGAIAIVAVVLGAIAIFGDSSGSQPNSAATDTAGTEIAAGEEGKVTQAVLAAADGSDADGRAVFGRVGQEEIVLQVTAENLEPTAKGESYTVWLYRNPKLTLRVGSVPVGEEGNLGARFTIPAELLAYVASGAFNQIYISRTENAAYQREVAQAKRNKSLPRYVGDTVLTGKITGPIAEQAGGKGGGSAGQ
jgi:hypothetical protein